MNTCECAPSCKRMLLGVALLTALVVSLGSLTGCCTTKIQNNGGDFPDRPIPKTEYQPLNLIETKVEEH